MNNRKIWFVEFPTFQYKEDVKVLARQKNLKVVDARFKADFREELVAVEVPKLTKKPAKKAE